MAVVLGGILCQELVADYEEVADVQAGFSATKKYLVPWANRFAVAHAILGLSTTVSVGGVITLNYPLAYPELAAETSNALASCYARTIHIKPVGNPTQGTYNVQWPYAIISVNFGAFPWTFQGIDYQQLDPSHPYVWAEQHMTYSSEYITIPGNAVYWKSSMKVVSSSGQADWGFLSPQLDMTITLKNVPYLPAQNVLTALAAPISSATYLGVNAGYLMFRGGQNDRTQSSDGTQTSDVSLQFSARSIAPWDYQFNPMRAGGKDPVYGYWDQIVAPDGSNIVGRGDLSTIIPAAYVA